MSALQENVGLWQKGQTSGPYTGDSKTGEQKQVSQDPHKHHLLPTSALEDPSHRQWPQELNL